MLGAFGCSNAVSKGRPRKSLLTDESPHGGQSCFPRAGGMRAGRAVGQSSPPPRDAGSRLLALPLPLRFWLYPPSQPCCWEGSLLPLLLGTAYGFQRGSCFKPNFTVGLTEAKGGQTIRLRSLNKWLRLNLNPRRCPFPALAVPAGPDGLLNAASRSSAFSLPHCFHCGLLNAGP